MVRARRAVKLMCDIKQILPGMQDMAVLCVKDVVVPAT
jgi:hypothetical protein